MLGKLARFFSGNSTSAPNHPLLTRIEVAIGNGIDEAPDFAQRLLPATQAAIEYFERQIAAIPGPSALASSPLFDAEQISHALGRSLEVKEAMKERASDDKEVYALLGMRLKTTNNGSPHLADHTLRSLAESADDCREKLCLAAFDRLLCNFAYHVKKLQHKDQMQPIRWEWALQHDTSKIVANEIHPPSAAKTRELTPDSLVSGLLSWLAAPECFLRMEAAAPTGNDVPAATQKMPMLHCSDRRQWYVSLVSFPAAEAAAALQRETHNHRYILI
ncbi:MAG: hypothetical protein FWC58_09925 [Desulfobulbus sp.]|nr:hypothetical protein [Desulfobulbus sp.]